MGRVSDRLSCRRRGKEGVGWLGATHPCSWPCPWRMTCSNPHVGAAPCLAHDIQEPTWLLAASLVLGRPGRVFILSAVHCQNCGMQMVSGGEQQLRRGTTGNQCEKMRAGGRHKLAPRE